MAASDFDQVIEQSHVALNEFVKGNSGLLKDLYSHKDDVTLANPYGPPVRGWQQAAETMDRAASNYRDGEATGFEGIARHVTSELACIVEIERYKARVAGSADLMPIAIRVTSVLRPEDGTWKIVHRHADPITTPRSAESIVQS
jgi:ketosteroid isomerase-like protein